MSDIKRASDLIEINMQQAAMAGGGAVLCLLIGVPMVAYQSSLMILGWLLIGFATIAIVFAIIKMVASKSIPVERVQCPYCQQLNALTGKPTSEFTCMHCLRLVPFENGLMLPVYKVNCESCQKQNFFSKKTIKLICEDCGKEINLDSIRNLVQ
ncbi:MAG: hypothetical protein J0L72_10145 [Armatimonadetes bacterium]|nr:hypothetical protein [Armatimonadota bacterium]